MKGTLYGVGVGPGDPELITLKAVRIIKKAEVVACPGEDVLTSAAYRIAARIIPEIKEKCLLPVPMPMVMDREQQALSHRKGAEQLKAVLDSGRDVAFLTLGDPGIYSTFSCLQHILRKDGYSVSTVSGVPSFCAAAAALNIPLAEWNEELHIIPAVHEKDLSFRYPGSYVLMKSGTGIGRVRTAVNNSRKRAFLADRCGMPEERLYTDLSDFPDSAGYLSLMIVKDRMPDTDELP